VTRNGLDDQDPPESVLAAQLTALADTVTPVPPDLAAAQRRARAVTARRRLAAGALGAAAVAVTGALTVLPGPSGADRLEQRYASPPPDPQPTAPPSAVPSTIRELPAERLVQLVGGRFGTSTARFHMGPPLRVGKDLRAGTPPADDEFSSVAVVFDTTRTDADCLDRAVLRLRVQPGADAGGEIAAYASAARSLALGQEPPAGSGGPATLLDNRPRGTATIKPGGDALELDVTDLTRLWISGDAFPSTGRRVPAGSPLVLLVRPPDATDGTYGTDVLAAALVMTETPSC
jgi:hypothetical protein